MRMYKWFRREREEKKVESARPPPQHDWLRRARDTKGGREGRADYDNNNEGNCDARTSQTHAYAPVKYGSKYVMPFYSCLCCYAQYCRARSFLTKQTVSSAFSAENEKPKFLEKTLWIFMCFFLACTRIVWKTEYIFWLWHARLHAIKVACFDLFHCGSVGAIINNTL